MTKKIYLLLVLLWGIKVLHSWRYLYPHMYGRNEVEIPHHHGFDVNLQNEWTHRCQGLCEMKYETQLVGLEMEMEMGLFYFF